MKLRTAVALILTAAVLAGGGAWAAEGWFPDVPDDHRRIDAIRYAKTEGLFQGFPDGNLRPDDELSEGQFIKVAERLYDRYDVWTRADWAQVMYGGLPSLTNTPSPATTAAPATTAPVTIPVATVPGIGSPCGWPLGPPQRISAATAPPAQIRFSVRPCAPPVTYRVEFNGGQMFNLPFASAASGFTPPLAWPASLTTGTVRVTEYRPGGPANGKVLGETKIPWDSVLIRPPAPTTTTTTTTTTPPPTTTTTTTTAAPPPTRAPTVTVPPPAVVRSVPLSERDVVVHWFRYPGNNGYLEPELGSGKDSPFYAFYVADIDGPINFSDKGDSYRDSYDINLKYHRSTRFWHDTNTTRLTGCLTGRGCQPPSAFAFVNGYGGPYTDMEVVLLDGHPFRSVTVQQVEPPASLECVGRWSSWVGRWSSNVNINIKHTVAENCWPAEWDKWWGVRANAPAVTTTTTTTTTG